MSTSDVAMLDRLLSPDLIFTNHLGQVISKSQDIELHKSGLLKIGSLETLEEISVEGREEFLHAGGENFHYIPCLNDEDRWIEVVKTLCEEKLGEFYLV